MASNVHSLRGVNGKQIKVSKIFPGEYRVIFGDEEWLVAKREGKGWDLFAPRQPGDDREKIAMDDSEWLWSQAFDSKKEAIAWIQS